MDTRYTLGLLFFFQLVLSHPLCRDTTGPQPEQLTFCAAYSTDSCCSPAVDSQKQSLFASLSITDQTCAPLMKGLLCSECDAYAAHLYGDEYQTPSKVPSLCHSYCEEFYSACANVNMDWPSTFPTIFGANPISSAYPDATSFCTKFFSTLAPDYCYNGTVFVPIPPPPTPAGTPEICTEHFMPNGIAEDEQMLWLADPNDGTDRIFAVYKRGEIIARNRTTGDLIGRFAIFPNVFYNSELGLLSMAFHPNFTTNRKFYVYYTTEQLHAPCTSDEICGGSQCVEGECNGNWTSVVSELTSYAQDPTSADPDSERILLLVNQPFANHKAGGLMFGPDGYLYIPFGDGGSGNDPHNNAQNLNRWHGKMLRIDVNGEDTTRGLAYRIPSDNPFINGNRPEIWAYGLRNPWRCSFDKDRPDYHICGDVGQDLYEEVDLISKGSNYGWRKYEGLHLNMVNIDDPEFPEIKPILEYNHSDPRLGSGPAIIGGYFYRGNKDVCNYGRYIYCDWTGPLWSAIETADGSGIFTTAPLTYQCAADSPDCAGLGNILSFSEDANGDVYILGHEGVMRIADASRCPSLVTCNALSTSASSAATSSSDPTVTDTTSPTSSGSSMGSSRSGSGSGSASNSMGSASCSSAPASSRPDGSNTIDNADVSSASLMHGMVIVTVASLLLLL